MNGGLGSRLLRCFGGVLGEVVNASVQRTPLEWGGRVLQTPSWRQERKGCSRDLFSGVV